MTDQQIVNKRLGDDVPLLLARVVDELRQRILSRQLKPGERLIESKLALELGVSRNPVREAIRVLASEGLVEVNSRRSAAVIEMSQNEARETIEVRALLEGQNARLAARQHDPQVIRRIETVLSKGVAAVANGRLDELTTLNDQFHQELADAGQNSVLRELLKRLRERTAILFTPTSADEQRRRWDEHAGILRAIIAGDEQLAARVAAEHVMRAGARYLMALAVMDASLTILPTMPRGLGTKKSRPKSRA